MTIIASARQGIVTFQLPAGSYHLGEVAVDALLKDRFSEIYREIRSLATGLISCGSRLLVVANVFSTGAAWDDSPYGSRLCREEGFSIVPVDMVKPIHLRDSSTITSHSGVGIKIDVSKGVVRIEIDGLCRTLVDDDAAVFGRTRGHSLEELARAYDRVRERHHWTTDFETTIKGELPATEIQLIGHAIEFFTGTKAGVIEMGGETIFTSDGVDRDRLYERSEEVIRVEQAAALLR